MMKFLFDRPPLRPKELRHVLTKKHQKCIKKPRQTSSSKIVSPIEHAFDRKKNILITFLRRFDVCPIDLLLITHLGKNRTTVVMKHFEYIQNMFSTRTNFLSLRPSPFLNFWTKPNRAPHELVKLDFILKISQFNIFFFSNNISSKFCVFITSDYYKPF